jgi:hypothetical protein
MSLRLLAALVVAGLGGLAAADLGPPTRITIHPDGASLAWVVSVPDGGIEVDLPAAPAGAITVDGATWSISETRLPAPAPPPALIALIAERNRLDESREVLDDEERLEQQSDERLLNRLPGVDPASATASWVPAIDAAITRRSGLQQRRLAWDAAQRELIQRAEAIAPGGASALHLGMNGQITEAALAGAWSGAASPAPVRRLRLDHATGRTATIRLGTDELRWTPSAVLAVADGTTSLTRRATLTKPMAIDLPPVETDLVATNRSEPLRGPEERPVDIAADPIASISRRLVSVTSSRAPSVERPRVTASATPRPAADIPVIGAAPEPPATAGDLSPERWQVGVMALTRGQSRMVVDLPAEALTLADDRWELAPLRAPIAQRHAIVTLAGRGLQPGPLTIVLDGRVTGSGWFQGAAPGTAIDLCLEEDTGIFVEPGVVWQPGEGDRTPTRHKEGWTWRIHHLGTVRRQVRFLASTAVSRLREVSITLLPDTSPGSSEPSPGMRAWDLDLAPGASTAIGIGWTITTSGGFTLR